MSQLQSMTPEEINAEWDRVASSLESMAVEPGSTPPASAGDTE
jgi:hypothetical protein